MINARTPIITAYSTIIATVLGIFAFSRRLTKGFNKKYKNPEMIIGKNNVDAKTTMGSNKNEIFVET